MGGRDANVRRWRSIIRLSDRSAGKLRMSQLTNDDRDDRLIRLSRPATIGNEIRRHVGQLRPIITVAAEDNTEEMEQKARRIRGFLREFMRVAGEDYRRAGGPGSLIEGMTRYAYEDGQVWLCVMPYPQRVTMPLKVDIYDSITCIPVWSGGKLKRFYHVAVMTVEEIRDRWGAGLLPGRDGDDTETTIGCYDETYIGVMLGPDGKNWLKSPVAHGLVDSDGNGIVPVAAFFQNGFTGDSTQDTKDSKEDIEANRGRSSIADHESELTELSKLITAGLYIAYRDADPPLLQQESAEGTEYELSTRPGAHNRVPSDVGPDGVRPLTASVPGTAQNIQNSMQFLTAEMDTDLGTIAGKETEFKSGTDRFTAAEQAQSYFAPITELLREAITWLCTVSLQIYKCKDYQDVLISDDSKRTGWPYRAQFSPDDVPADPVVDVEFTETSRMKKMQVAAAMAPLLQNGGATPQMMFEMMGVDNPELETQRLMEWRAQQHPDVVQSEGPYLALANLEYLRDQFAERGDTDMANLIELDRRIQLKTAFLAKEEELKRLMTEGLPKPQPQEPQGPPPMGMNGMGGPPPMMPPQGPPSGQGIPPEILAALAAQQGGGMPQPGIGPGGPLPNQIPIQQVGQTGIPPGALPPGIVTGTMDQQVIPEPTAPSIPRRGY